MLTPMEYTDHRLAAVMYTDIVGFSRMMEEDEQGTLLTLDFHNTLLREQITRFRGAVIKTIGDAFLAQFATTLDAVQCSLAVQNAIREYNEAKLGKSLTLRIGVHLGDIHFSENDALGEGINIASRLQSATRPGHITISREVYGQVSGKIPMRVESMGQVHLKNITREVHAYEIIPGGEDNDSVAFRKAQKVKQGLDPDAPEPGPGAPRPTRASGEPFPTPPGPPPSFRDLRDEWRSLRSQIKDEVKAELRGGPQRWSDVKHQIRGEFERSRWQGANPATNFDPASVVKQIFHDPLDDLKRADGSPASAFQVYKQKKIRGAQRSRGGFSGHLVPFLGVNALLATINLTTDPTTLWFLIPLCGWGIGLVSHGAAAKAAQKTARELERLDDASDEDFRVIKKFQDSRAGFWAHAASNTAVAVLLGVIWFIAGGGFPWPLIPIAAMAIGVFSNLTGFAARRSEFKALWKSLVSGTRKPLRPGQGAPAAEPETDPLVRKARALRDSIVAQAQGMKGGNPFGDDMTVTLDNYVLQIAELSAIEQELGRVLVSFRPADLEAEAVAVRAKIGSTASQALKQEYEKSLSGIEKQQKSFGDLAEQQEILNLRIKGALGSLQQMQVDLARIKGLTDGQRDATFLPIKERSEELSRYIEDYREGLKETEN